MANRYVYSGATGTGDGTSFTNAYTSLATAIAAGAAGDVYLIASDHVDTNTTASVTFTFKGTAAAPDIAISVNRTSGLPEVGARIQTSGGNFSITIATAASGVTTLDGLVINAASAPTLNTNSGLIQISPASFSYILARNCLLVTNANNSSRAQVNGSNCKVVFENTSVLTGGTASAQTLAATQPFTWRNSTPYVTSGSGFTGGSIPPVIFDTSTTAVTSLENCDLTAFSGKTTLTTAGTLKRISFSGCKMPPLASLPVANLNRADMVEIITCSDAGATDRAERHTTSGAFTLERTIARTGGASDGANPVTFKMQGTASNQRGDPITSLELAFNFTSAEVGAAKTLTFHTLTDGQTLTNAEFWAEVSYMAGNSALATQLSSAAGAIDTPTSLTSDTATGWTTTGVTTPVKQKVALTFTPQRAGDARVVFRMAKAGTGISSLVYVDPKADIT